MVATLQNVLFLTALFIGCVVIVCGAFMVVTFLALKGIDLMLGRTDEDSQQ